MLSGTFEIERKLFDMSFFESIDSSYNVSSHDDHEEKYVG